MFRLYCVWFPGQKKIGTFRVFDFQDLPDSVEATENLEALAVNTEFGSAIGPNSDHEDPVLLRNFSQSKKPIWYLDFG